MNFRRVLIAPIRISQYLFNRCLYGHIGLRTHIERPLRIEHKKNIYLYDGVSIASYCWLAANPKTSVDGKARLIVREGCSIGDFAHIYATQEILIDKNALIANFVYISDNIHGYEDISIPIIQQPIVQKRPVHIGEGSWIGEHVCIIGANVGKHSVIGANSVVTHDIPDYCVAVGAPARVIKKYSFENQEWINV